MALKAGIQLSVDKKGNLKVIDLVRGDVRKLNAETKRSTAELRKMRKQSQANAASLQNLGTKAKFAGGALLAAFGVGNLASDILRVGNAVNGFESNLTATFGTLEAGKGQLEFVREEANRLGLEYLTLAKNYSGWSAATERSTLAGETQREIFSSIAESARVMNLSVDDTNGVFRALTQIISKGKVQAEELRGQMGERIPGAFQIAAKSMGLTTAELDKALKDGKVYAEEFLPNFAKELRNTFGGGLDAATNNLQANTNRIKNGFEQLQEIAFDGVEDSLNSLAVSFATALEDTEGVFLAVGAAMSLFTAKIVGEYSKIIAAGTLNKVAHLKNANEVILSNAAIAASDSKKTAAILRSAVLEQNAAAANMATVRARMAVDAQAVISTGAYTAAKVRLANANAALVVAESRATVATNALSAAQARASLTGRVMLGVATGLRGALALIGGPAGLALLAGSAIYYLSKQADKAKTSIALANGTLVTHEDLLSKVESATYKYADATIYERGEITKTIRAELLLAKAHRDTATARLESAKNLKLDAINKLKDSPDNFATRIFGKSGIGQYKKATKEFEEAAAEIAKSQNTIYRIESELANIDKPPAVSAPPKPPEFVAPNSNGSGSKKPKQTDAQKQAIKDVKELAKEQDRLNKIISKSEQAYIRADKLLNEGSLSAEAYDYVLQGINETAAKNLALKDQEADKLDQERERREKLAGLLLDSEQAYTRANILLNEGSLAAETYDYVLQGVNETTAKTLALKDQQTEKLNEEYELREKLKQSFIDAKQALEDEYDQLIKSPEAWYKAQLAAEGYDAAQVSVLSNQHFVNESIKESQDFYASLYDSAVQSGDGIKGVWKSIGDTVVSELQRMAKEKLLSGLFGDVTAAGGRDGGLFGDIFGGFLGLSPGRANGGAVYGGGINEIVERGEPETLTTKGRTYLLSASDGNVQPLQSVSSNSNSNNQQGSSPSGKLAITVDNLENQRARVTSASQAEDGTLQVRMIIETTKSEIFNDASRGKGLAKVFEPKRLSR